MSKELTREELDIVMALLEFVGDGNIGFEALEGYKDIDDETIWEDATALKTKIKTLQDE